METERKLLKIPLGFRSKIPRRGIYEYQRPENFAKHNALCKRDENYGILMGKPNNAICLDYDIYDPNCKEKQKYTLEYFKKVCGDDVYISRTPSGGYHAVFRYEARFDTWKNATKINGFIDIRTTGGYICGNGCETEKGSYRRLSGNILKLTNMPDTLYDMVAWHATEFRGKKFKSPFGKKETRQQKSTSTTKRTCDDREGTDAAASGADAIF